MFETLLYWRTPHAFQICFVICFLFLAVKLRDEQEAQRKKCGKVWGGQKDTEGKGTPTCPPCNKTSHCRLLGEPQEGRKPSLAKEEPIVLQSTASECSLLAAQARLQVQRQLSDHSGSIRFHRMHQTHKPNFQMETSLATRTQDTEMRPETRAPFEGICAKRQD